MDASSRGVCLSFDSVGRRVTATNLREASAFYIAE